MGENSEIVINEQDRQIILKNQNLTQIVISNKSTKLVKQVTTFNASNNSITQMSGIRPFINLIVLNLSHNNIGEMSDLDQFKSLSALILNNNKITKIQGLEHCLEINTIVLSHNLLTGIDGIQHLNKLKKLSISHNQIAVILFLYIGSRKLQMCKFRRTSNQ
ncbi:hypothetical protein FGO68_gene3949 [Halteria grandinella]|uniref:Leucine-rich repeat domain-containing protein n=1 Tax=Halteria grandinella TaxID=5974 RepID=A0A8J8NG11_HALGN|nr:hypothetical protein FGO68_gene3949 [Halteria grandinella]